LWHGDAWDAQRVMYLMRRDEMIRRDVWIELVKEGFEKNGLAVLNLWVGMRRTKY